MPLMWCIFRLEHIKWRWCFWVGFHSLNRSVALCHTQMGKTRRDQWKDFVEHRQGSGSQQAMGTHPRVARLESPCQMQAGRGNEEPGSPSPTAAEEQRGQLELTWIITSSSGPAAANPRPGVEVAGGINTPKPLSSHCPCCYLPSREPNWKLEDKRSWYYSPWKTGS